MRATDADRLLAAAIPVRSALRALDENAGNMGGTYHSERVIAEARRLAAVVDAVTAQESTGSSGSVLPD